MEDVPEDGLKTTLSITGQQPSNLLDIVGNENKKTRQLGCAGPAVLSRLYVSGGDPINICHAVIGTGSAGHLAAMARRAAIKQTTTRMSAPF